jgi:hypothetical protein
MHFPLAISITLTLLFILFQQSSCLATDYYVDQNHPSASDSNPGTEAQPWLTVEKARQTAKAGDTVYFKQGVYKGPLWPQNSGTPDNWITFKNFENDKVIIEGAREVTGWSMHSGNIYVADWDSSWLDPGYGGISGEVGFVNVDRKCDYEHYLKPSITISGMTEGSWHFDNQNKKLYVWLYNNENPANHDILSTWKWSESHAVLFTSHQRYIIFDGFDVRLGAFNVHTGNAEDNHHIIFRNLNIYCGMTNVLFDKASSYITLEDSEIHHSQGVGIQLNAAHSTVRNNEIHHGGIIDWMRWACASIILMGPYNLVENNTIHHNSVAGCYTSGIGMETWGPTEDNPWTPIPGPDTSRYNTVRYNKIYGMSPFTGIVCSGCDNNLIHNNLIYDMGYGISLRKGGECAGTTSEEHKKTQNNKIYNNVIANNPPGPADQMAIQLSSSAYGNEFKNNIIFNGGVYDLWVNVGTSGNGNILDNNIWYNSNGFKMRWEGSTLNSLSAYQSASGQGAYSKNADPLFVNAAGNIFYLQSDSSPAKDAGVDVGLTQDFDGNPIVGIPDIGAYEYQGTLPTCSSLGGTGCSQGQSCQGGSFQTSSDYGNLCCVSGTCYTEPTACPGFCCDACESGPIPGYDSDCPGQVCCSTCQQTQPPVDGNQSLSFYWDSAITIDGDGSDWYMIKGFEVPYTSHAPGYSDEPCSNSQDCSAVFKSLWTDTHLLVLVEVSDDYIVQDSSQPHQDDSVELYIDGGNEGAGSYDSNDFQLTVDTANSHSGVRSDQLTFEHDVSLTPNGFVVEYAVPFSALEASSQSGRVMGFDVGFNDDDNGGDRRETQLMWHGDGTGYQDPGQFGEIMLKIPHRADNNLVDGLIEIQELISFLDNWKSPGTDIGMTELMDAIRFWRSGAAYP